MTRMEQIRRLNDKLLAEMPQYRQWGEGLSEELPAQRQLWRALANVRPPIPLVPDFLELQDRVLSEEREEKGVVDVWDLPEVPGHPGIAVWRGDITRLKCGAIVNAANSALLGCFQPCHDCIDNAIHTAAGAQLRQACYELMAAQGHDEPTGQAKLTPGFNLPARYVLHTVGPIIYNQVTAKDRELLGSCYRSCLELAAEHGIDSVAFCCISTGVFHFPKAEAARIAVETVEDFLKTTDGIKRVVFDVFSEWDEGIYHDILSAN